MLDAKLTTLLAVAETGNFTRAAELLSLTQPAVSHHIAQLEAELGAALLVRSRRARAAHARRRDRCALRPGA